MDRARVLIIDDETDLMEMVSLRLEANGYQVIFASDGQEGLDKARTEKPDLIILDLMLPKIEGYKYAVCSSSMRNINIYQLYCLRHARRSPM